jgi:hypothetical protein
MIPMLPEVYKIVDATAGCVTTNGGVTGQYVSTKNAQFVFLVLQFTQAVGFAEVITLQESTSIAGAGAKAVVSTHLIWSNETTVGSDTLVRQTDAKTYTTNATGSLKKMVVFGINPAALDIANGFYVVNFTLSDSSQATNFVAGAYYLMARYPQATPATAVA